jgi:HK97 family phage portal protein
MSFSTWLRGLNIRPAVTNQFFSLAEPSNNNALSDAKAMEQALISGAWYSISQTAAKAVASLPIKLAVENAKGEFEEITEGDYYNLIFYPNKNQTLSELWELQSLYYFINGEFYNYHQRESIGFVDGEILSLPPEAITVLTSELGKILSTVTGYEFTDRGQVHNINPEDILHVKMPNPTLEGRESKNGLSPLQAGQNLLNGSINIETALAWYFENRGASMILSGDSSDPSMSLKSSDKAALELSLMQRLGGAFKMNKSVVTSTPIKATQLNASSSDMQMIDNQNLVIERLCALIDMPPILVGVNTSSTYNNVKEAKTQMATNLTIPTAERYIKGYDRTLLKEFTEATGKRHIMYVDKGEVDVLHPSSEEVRDQNRKDVEAGIMTPNEARAKSPLSLDPMDDPQAEELHFKTQTTINGN